MIFQTLQELKLDVEDAVVFLDREQGGAANLTAMGINVISVINITKVSFIVDGNSVDTNA